jgi:predicted alpha/beta superfamily hydrolase
MLDGQIDVHNGFRSDPSDMPRKFLVYLPPGYGADPQRRYPVLYLNDGQNLIDPREAVGGIAWGVDRTADSLIREGAVEPLIIVGVYHGGRSRIDEYTHVRSETGRMRGHGGKADEYGRMLAGDLKPFIDTHYLTKPEREFTGLGGSSLGGLVSLYLGLTNPEVFSRLAVMSPSVWWANNQIIRDAARLGERLPLRIWLDIGKREGPRIKHQVRALKEILLANGWQTGLDFAYYEIPGARHDEASWGERFGEALKFLFPVV